MYIIKLYYMIWHYSPVQVQRRERIQEEHLERSEKQGLWDGYRDTSAGASDPISKRQLRALCMFPWWHRAKRDVTWAAITAPDAAAPSDCRWLSAMCNSCHRPAICGSATCTSSSSSSQIVTRAAGDSSEVAWWVAALLLGQNCFGIHNMFFTWSGVSLPYLQLAIKKNKSHSNGQRGYGKCPLDIFCSPFSLSWPFSTSPTLHVPLWAIFKIVFLWSVRTQELFMKSCVTIWVDPTQLNQESSAAVVSKQLLCWRPLASLFLLVCVSESRSFVCASVFRVGGRVSWTINGCIRWAATMK